MLIRATSHSSGEKFYLSKFWLITIVFMLLYIQIQAQNGWTLKSYLPTGRAGASATVFDNKIYVMGGITQAPNFTNLAVNEVYNPLTNTWETKLPMPTARGFLFTDVVNNIIYAIIGGYRAPTNNNEAYDPTTDSWTTKANMLYPWVGIYGGVINDKIYLTGGDYDEQKCFIYDPAANIWTEKTPIPTNGCKGTLSATVYNGLLYTFGGSRNYPNDPLSTVNVYNPLTDTWDTTLAHMPTPRYALRTFLVSDKIYAIGGCQSTGSSLATVEVYDPIKDTWETKPDMPFELSWFTGAVFNSKIYLFGGTNDWLGGDGAVWEYDPTLDPSQVELSSTTTANYMLVQNYPNPFNNKTIIRYSLPKEGLITLQIYNILGEKVATSVNETKQAGNYETTFNSGDLSSGVYIYKMQAGEFVQTKKMILLK